MAAAFGVHLGSTSACLAVYKDGKTDVVANDAGDRVTPAVVAFTDHDQTVGLAAKQGLIRNAANTVCNVKNLIGRLYDDPVIQQAVQDNTVKIINKDGKPYFEVDYKEKQKAFSTDEIVTLIYQNMREIAQSHGEGNIHDAVLTVPIEFSNDQRQAISVGAEKAGFTVLRIINEPTAAVLAYDIGQTDVAQSCKVLVYRLGGSSLDVSVIAVVNGMYHILATVSDDNTGGHDFTNALVEHFAEEFKRQWKGDVHENKRSMTKLRIGSELCKHILSTMPSAQSSIESLYDGIDFRCNISRSRFDALCGTLRMQLINPVEKVLNLAGLNKMDINKVILCGGSTKIPSLQSQLCDYFKGAEILSSIAPDEVIAIGAAKQAAILTGNDVGEMKLNEAETQVPCLTKTLLIKTVIADSVDQFEPVFPMRTPVPVRRQKKFKLTPGQTSFCLELHQGDFDSTQNASQMSTVLLAKIVMKELPEEADITAVFHIRSDGSLHMTCTEHNSNKTEDVIIEAS